MKKIYLDLETTGLDPVKNGITQIAGYICCDGKGDVPFNFKMQPLPQDIVEDRALEVQGITKEDLAGYQDPRQAYSDFSGLLGQYVDKFNKSDKFLFIGYNARFDMDFLRAWFTKNNDKYFGSFFYFPPIDIMAVAAWVLQPERADMKDFKLGTVAERLGVELGGDSLHDAFTDIRLTKEIERVLLDKMINHADELLFS